MGVEPINIPRIPTRACIAMKARIRCIDRLVTRLIRPAVAPVKVRTWLKAFALAMIRSIITVSRRVDIRDLTITPQLRPLCNNTRSRQPRTPVAAASDGVAIPKRMTPVTRKTTRPTGSTLRMKDNNFSEKGMGITS